MGLKFRQLHYAKRLQKALELIKPLEHESKCNLQPAAYAFLERRGQHAQNKLDFETVYRLDRMLFDLKCRGITDVK